MNTDQLIATIGELHLLDRERVCEAGLDEVRTHILLAEVQDRYDAIDDANEIVAFCKQILQAESEMLDDMEAAEALFPPSSSSDAQAPA